MRRRSLTTILGAAAVLTAVSPLPAQQWNLDAQAGRIRSALDPSAAASQSVVLGVRYDDVLSALRISGGVPTQSGDPLWGAVAAAHRFAASTHGFSIGADVAGNAFLLHDRVQRTQQVPGGIFNQPTVQPAPSLSGSAYAGQAMPLVGYQNGSVQFFARGGVSQYSSDFAGQQKSRTVRMADAQLTFAPAASVAVMPVARYYSAKEGNYTYAGATVLVSSGALSAWGTAGKWLNRSSEATPWSAGASLRVLERASINAGVRSDAIDPLYLAPPQHSWSIGASLLIGGRPVASAAAPIPAHYSAGRATIELPAAASSTAPSIAGDFTNWKPVPMQRAGSTWIYSAALQPGVYNFSFVDGKGDWFVPEKYPGRKDDGMGGHVAVLVVQK